MIRRIATWLLGLFQPPGWVHHPEDRTWHKGAALIEQRGAEYWLWRDYRPHTIHGTLQEAFEEEAAGH